MSGINLEKESVNTDTPDEFGGISSSSGSGGPGIAININLLGYEVREEIEKSSSGLKISKPLVITIMVVAAAILINAISYIVLVGLRDEQIEVKKELESRKAELDSKSKELASLQTQKTTAEQKLAIMNWAAGNNFKWSELLEEIRDRIPSNLWVGGIEISQDFKLNIRGETYDHKTVALFLANLQDSPAFRNVVLDYTKKTSPVEIKDIENAKQTEKEKLPANNLNEKAKAVSSKDLALERQLGSVTSFNIRCDVVVSGN